MTFYYKKLKFVFNMSKIAFYFQVKYPNISWSCVLIVFFMRHSPHLNPDWSNSVRILAVDLSDKVCFTYIHHLFYIHNNNFLVDLLYVTYYSCYVLFCFVLFCRGIIILCNPCHLINFHKNKL